MNSVIHIDPGVSEKEVKNLVTVEKKILKQWRDFFQKKMRSK